MHQSEQEGKGVLCIDRSFVGSFNKVVAKTHEGFCLLSQTKNNVVVRTWCASLFLRCCCMEKKNEKYETDDGQQRSASQYLRPE